MKISLDSIGFLKKAKKQEILIFGVAVCLLLLAGYYLMFLSPVITKFLKVYHEASKVQSKIDKTELSIGRLPVLKKEIDELKAKAVYYSSKLPKEEEFPVVLESLSKMALDTGVKITKIMPVKESEEESSANQHSDIYSQESILIDAQCGYHQLGTFISELENAERFMEVSDIRIEANKTNPKRHNVQLIVKTFISKGQ